jgi:AcrR family transcriptional regulator
MGRKSLKDTRRLEIIEIFYRVAREEGYENTSIAKIAKVMDVNPSLILHYFTTKEDLTYALIDYILERYLLIFTIENKEKIVLSDLINTIEILFSKKWNLLFDDGLFYTFYALAFREKIIREKYKTILDSLRLEFASMIEQCHTCNLINVPDYQAASDLIFVLVDGAYFYLSLEKDKEVYDQRLDYYKVKAYQILGIDPSNISNIPVVSYLTT